nr:hypothetical protein 9 [bacterium]
MPISDLDFYGPNVLNKPEQTQAPVQSDDIFAVQEQLLKAEQMHDHMAVQRLSMRLDDMLSGMPTEAPQEPVQEHVDISEDVVEQPEEGESEEVVDDAFASSAFNRSLVNELGEDGANEIYEIINNTGDGELISAFMESAQTDGNYAGMLTDWARNVQAAGATPSADVTAVAFDSAQEQAIRSSSEFGDEIMALNTAVTSGQMTKAQLFQQVMQNPGLMAEAVRLRDANLISF